MKSCRVIIQLNYKGWKAIVHDFRTVSVCVGVWVWVCVCVCVGMGVWVCAPSHVFVCQGREQRAQTGVQGVQSLPGLQ